MIQQMAVVLAAEEWSTATVVFLIYMYSLTPVLLSLPVVVVVVVVVLVIVVVVVVVVEIIVFVVAAAAAAGLASWRRNNMQTACTVFQESLLSVLQNISALQVPEMLCPHSLRLSRLPTVL